jgi:hypothetical protein
VFSENGVLFTQCGYNPETQYWYHDDLREPVGEIPQYPSQEEIDGCRSLLVHNLLGDFPFKDEASLAHSIGAILLPFVRPMIDGATPLHLFDASTPGTGKSLLAGLISLITLGSDAPMMTEAHGEEEWRKRITATLMQAPILTLIDNVGQKLDSPALSAAITSSEWKDRVLGQSKTVQIPVRTMWLATGNNVEVSNEMSRRTVWCRLVPDTERPWERTKFSHPNIRQWVKKHRAELLRAILTIIQGWISADRPSSGKSLGNFETWAEVIGGILAYAGIPGFLGNAKDFYAKADSEMEEWRVLVSKWWAAFGEKDVPVRELYQLAQQNDIFTDLFASRSPNTHTSVFGKSLTTLVDRNIGGFFILADRRDRGGSKLYRLKPAKE